MVELMDVDSEHEHTEAKYEDKATYESMQIDSGDMTTCISTKSKFNPGSFSKTPASRGIGLLKTRTNRFIKASNRKFKGEKRQKKLDRSTTPNLKQHVPIRRHEKQQLSEGNLHEIRKKQSACVISLSHRLIGLNPLGSFAENCEKTIPDWITLLGKTMLPTFINSSHPCIIAAFKAVDSIICGDEGTHLLRRLAYIELMRLFASLEAIIKYERETGRISREPGYGNASLALDIYMSAQESHPHPNDLRRELREQAAEPVVKDFKRFDSATLKLVAARVLEECPKELVQISIQLAERVESAVRSDLLFDMRQVTAARIRQSLKLA
ncbi:hypothetical protein FOXB_06696 [Fusarium oxysporum f. sp. conglutinans Fo5176]|uniref:Uncharacterized protein n=1 Tax=Fusarium oxysporum (strain Fo5176) TaxID=660025 RepID=F9FJW7_FUSOF|nr:hypothetical protein FOXB_06696 [Fusarium oxysporum f. sp. conglutinans Fo5176]